MADQGQISEPKRVTLEPSGPMLAWRCEGLVDRLRAAGYEVTINTPVERRGFPGLLEGLTLLVLAKEYQGLRQLIVEWFTEEPDNLKNQTQVMLFDQGAGRVVDDFTLGNEDEKN